MAVPETPITREEKYLDAMVKALDGGGGGGSGGSGGVEIVTVDAALVTSLMGAVTYMTARLSSDPVMMRLQGTFRDFLESVTYPLANGKMPILDAVINGNHSFYVPVSADLLGGVSFEMTIHDTVGDGEGGEIYYTYLFKISIMKNEARIVGTRYETSSYD